MNNPCIFSDCRQWRYVLEHRWSDGPLLQVIGLNPSTADENQLDPTLRRVAGFARSWGYGGFVMNNLFAYRSTDPEVMLSHPDPIGPDNDHWIRATALRCEATLAAWGADGGHMNRDFEVARLLFVIGVPLHCLGMTKERFPRHPLYVRGDTRMEQYSVANRVAAVRTA